MDRFQKHGIMSEVKVLECLRMLWAGLNLQVMNYQGQIGRETTPSYMEHFKGTLGSCLDTATFPMDLDRNSCMTFMINMERWCFPDVLVLLIA